MDLRSTLFGSWSDIAALGRALPRLQSLRLDNNRFSPRLPYPLPADHALRAALPRLSVLILSRTALDFGQVLALEAALPNLQELHLCGNNLTTFDPPRTTYGAWASTTGDRRNDNRGRVGKPLLDRFTKLRVLNLSENAFDDWRQIWRLAWLPSLEKLLLNDNRLTEIRHLGEWDDLADSVRQSEVADYEVVYDAEVIKAVPQPQEDDGSTAAAAGAAGTTGATPAEDHSTIDGASETKNQDMVKWARQTGVVTTASGAADATGAVDGALSAQGPRGPAFGALRSLSVSRNKIADWASLDAVDRLPGVEMLRLQHNPLNTEGGASATVLRQTMIARVGALKSLNGGEVRATERADAEKLYIKRLLTAQLKEQGAAAAAAASAESKAAGSATLASFVDVLSPEHPRVGVLLATHGEPAVRRATPGAHAFDVVVGCL